MQSIKTEPRLRFSMHKPNLFSQVDVEEVAWDQKQGFENQISTKATPHEHTSAHFHQSFHFAPLMPK